MPPNKIGRANRRCAAALNAGQQFESASCAPTSLWLRNHRSYQGNSTTR